MLEHTITPVSMFLSLACLAERQGNTAQVKEIIDKMLTSISGHPVDLHSILALITPPHTPAHHKLTSEFFSRPR